MARLKSLEREEAPEEARTFYGGLLGCPEGRSSDAWVDFDFYGHQIVAHLSPDEAGHRNTSAVDGDNVPVRHFGAILPIGLIMRIFGKDFLRLQRDSAASTYWLPRSDPRPPSESMRQQF